MPPKQKINGIAFHGSGGLLWYYMGIAQFIQDHYDTSNLQFCSVSGGCLPGVFLSSQLSFSTTPYCRSSSHPAPYSHQPQIPQTTPDL